MSDLEVVYYQDVEIVLNKSFGGFCLSDAAAKALELPQACCHGEDYWLLPREMSRADSRLVAVVKALGNAASGRNARLVVEEGSVSISITDHDGKESLYYR